MNHAAWADHCTGTAAQAFIRVNKCAVFRDLDCACGAGFFAKAAADTTDFADIFTDGILIRAEDNNGIILQTKMDHALRAGVIAGAAADAFALINFGNAVRVQTDCTERADLNTGTAAGAAIGTKIIAFRRFLCAAAAVAVNAGNFGRKLLFDDHKKLPFWA